MVLEFQFDELEWWRTRGCPYDITVYVSNSPDLGQDERGKS